MMIGDRFYSEPETLCLILKLEQENAKLRQMLKQLYNDVKSYGDTRCTAMKNSIENMVDKKCCSTCKNCLYHNNGAEECKYYDESKILELLRG